MIPGSRGYGFGFRFWGCRLQVLGQRVCRALRPEQVAGVITGDLIENTMGSPLQSLHRKSWGIRWGPHFLKQSGISQLESAVLPPLLPRA